MTQEEFNTFLEEVRARGFTHVISHTGPQPLEDWHPYGAFGGINPGIGGTIGGFTWLEHHRAADYAAKDPAGALTNGIWTFAHIHICSSDSEYDYFCSCDLPNRTDTHCGICDTCNYISMTAE